MGIAERVQVQAQKEVIEGAEVEAGIARIADIDIGSAHALDIYQGVPAHKA